MLIKWLHPTKHHVIIEKLGDIFWVNKQKKKIIIIIIIIPLFIKKHKDLLSYSASEYDKGLPYTMNFNAGTDHNTQ